MLTMTPVTVETADPIATPILQDIKQKYGMVPNFFGAMGIDGATLSAYLSFEEQLEQNMQLSEREKELISLAVANANGCHYCVSGHTFSAKKLGLTADECAMAQRGEASDPKEQALLRVVLRIIECKGNLEADDFSAAAEAGLSQEKFMQVTAWVAINSFSNWINNIVQPKIDFPKVALQGQP